MSSESRKKPEREATQGTDFSGAMVPGFDVSTAAQAASYFAQKAGGKIDMLKLIKLMYLAERKNMEVYDRPMFYDLFFSMEKGPVPSMVYYLIDGEKKDSEWSKHIRSRKKNSNIIECIGQGQFDHLSEADTEILEDVWQQFADLDGTEMAEWTHRHCTEWQNPSRGSQRITHQSIFRTLGKKRASRLAENVENHRLAKAALATGAWLPIEVGSAYLIPSGPPGKMHLGCVLAIYGKPPSAIYVTITSVREDEAYDDSCVLGPADHPFLEHESYVAYWDIAERRESFIQSQIDNAIFIPQTVFAPEVVEKIIQGAIRSKQTKPFAKRVLEEIFDS